MIIENCCCHNQLPDLASKSRGRVVPYHTNGDVTLENVLRAVSCLVGKSQVTIIAPALTNAIAKYLKFGYRRNWYTGFRILACMCSKSVDELPQCQEVISLTITESSHLLMLEGEYGRICLTGYHPQVSPVDSGKPYQLVNHTLLFQKQGESNDALWDDMVHIPTAKLRVSCKKK
jgi:hypothetical protein